MYCYKLKKIYNKLKFIKCKLYKKKYKKLIFFNFKIENFMFIYYKKIFKNLFVRKKINNLNYKKKIWIKFIRINKYNKNILKFKRNKNYLN